MAEIVAKLAFVSTTTVTGVAYWSSADITAPLSVEIYIDGTLIQQGRADERVASVPFFKGAPRASGWIFEIPLIYVDGDNHELEVYIHHGCDNITCKESFKIGSKEYIIFVDHVGSDHVYGWCRDRLNFDRRLTVALREGDRLVSLTRGSLFRKELADTANGDGRFGYRLPVPLSSRFSGAEFDIGIVESNGSFTRHDEVSIPRSTIKIAFITDTSYVGNASRMYRTELQANQLWRSGADVKIVDKSEASSSPIHCDVLVLQRAPSDNKVTAVVDAARANGALILYETDDLNTFPDLVDGMGSIRSGLRDSKDPAFGEELAGRMKSAHSSDAVLVPNQFMAKMYASRGFRTICSPFRIEDKFILRRKLAHTGYDWRLLYLSGSPTHRRDFMVLKDAVGSFLRAYPNVFLDVAGHVNEADFAGLPRVRFYPATDYVSMFARIDQSDCVLAPFERSTFNHGKSATKFMECGARGIPVIASDIPDYRHHIYRSGFGYAVRDDWRGALEKAYHKRGHDFTNSKMLCSYVAENFAQSEVGNKLLSDIMNLYDTVVCRTVSPMVVRQRTN